MVPTLTITFLIITALLTVLVPLLLFLRISKHSNQLFIPVIAGAVGFFVMQMVIRIPLLEYFEIRWGNIYVAGIFLGFTAALFETVGRVVTMKIFMKNDQRFFAGFAHGIGHGGIEAVMLVGLNFAVYVVFAFMINNGTFDSIPGVDSTTLEPIRDALVNQDSVLYLVSGVERMLAIGLHICLSILTVFALKKKDYKYLLIVLGIHTFVDFGVVVLGGLGASILLIELFVTAMVVVSILITSKVYNEYKYEGSEEAFTDY